MKKYLEAGFNRLSIGCQSADDYELRLLGRIHSFQDFCKTVEDARAAGFTNISADLMMALPGQTEESLLRSIDRIAALEPNHISVYGLKIEKGTWFDKHRDELCFPDEDTESELYLTTVSNLEKRGYYQYEISNFAKEGYESRHNLKYWHAKPYLGFGPAAYSYFENKRYGYKRDLSGYLEATRTLNFDSIKIDEEVLSYEETQAEKLLLGLRLKKGIVLNEFSFDDSVGGYIQTLCKNGLATYDQDRLSLTPNGMLLDNCITSELLLHLIAIAY
jgi:oxygen-independent coproporphyrinogen-3 oxidase